MRRYDISHTTILSFDVALEVVDLQLLCSILYVVYLITLVYLAHLFEVHTCVLYLDPIQCIPFKSVPFCQPNIEVLYWVTWIIGIYRAFTLAQLIIHLDLVPF